MVGRLGVFIFDGSWPLAYLVDGQIGSPGEVQTDIFSRVSEFGMECIGERTGHINE